MENSNRTIKFRAWDNKEKKWLLGYELPNLGGFSLTGETMLLGEWSHILDTFLFEREGYKHDDLKIMQYTGLKDKNGKEIYEGDIIQIKWLRQDGEVSKYLVSISWSEKMFGFRVILTIPSHITKREPRSNFKGLNWLRNFIDKDVRSVEIIGNLYEDSELLTPKLCCMCNVGMPKVQKGYFICPKHGGQNREDSELLTPKL